MLAIVRKELREHHHWIHIGLCLNCFLVWLLMPRSIHVATDLNEIKVTFGLVGCALALALGFLQSFWDFSEARSGYVLHRTITRNELLRGKILAGAIIYGIVMSVPMILFAIYFARKGPQELPLRPMQLLPTIIFVVLAFFLYLATIQTVLRPARYFGTKLLPLMAPLFGVGIYGLWASENNTTAWLIMLIIATVFALSTAVAFIEKLKVPTLILNSCLASILATFLVLGFIESTFTSIDPFRYEVVTTKSGEVWLIRARTEFHIETGSHRADMTGAVIDGNQPLVMSAKVPEVKEMDFSVPLYLASRPESLSFSLPTTMDVFGLRSLVYDPLGYMLLYEQEPFNLRARLIGYIGRNGLSAQTPAVENRFRTMPVSLYGWGLSNTTSERVVYSRNSWYDDRGVYQFDLATGACNVLVEESGIRAVSMINPREIAILTNDEIQIWRANDGTESTALAKVFSASTPFTNSNELSFLHVIKSNDIRYTVSDFQMVELPFQVASIETSPQSTWQVLQDIKLANNHERRVRPELIVLAIILSVVAISMLLTLYLLRSRGLSRMSQAAWVAGCIPLGLAVPLSLMALYPKQVCEACPTCNQLRRVDRSTCDNCKAEWEASEPNGICIIEGQGNSLTSADAMT
jgi:hypothetical protein